VVCDWISDGAKEEITAQTVADENQMLATLDADPSASLSSLAGKMGWALFNGDPNKTKVRRCLKSLKNAKLIKETRAGKHRLTDEGKKVLGGEDK
jgi:hypothetical protein